MRRFLSALLAGLAVLVGATPAFATVGPPVKIRWSGGWPAPARAGQEVVGRFELIAGEAGQIENLRLEGDGWSVRALDAPSTLVLPPKSHRQFTFRAVPADPTVPLEVRGTVNGIPFRRSFRLDADRRGTIGKPGEAIVTGAPAGLDGPQRDGGGTIHTTIRFHGRVVYTRSDAQVIGADNIVVRIMDKDPPPFTEDEQIGFVLTDAAGYFDFTTVWDDDDIGIADTPDVYLIVEASNLVTMVRTDDTEDMYDWTTVDVTIHDFPGADLNFGNVIPQTNVAAMHIFNSIIKADRHAREQGGMSSTPHVFVNWPDADDDTFYGAGYQEIHIGTDESWIEGTHVHEHGHFLQESYGSLQPTDLENGFCDTPSPGHCAWCPESSTDAWQEGWADWFASRMLRVWNGAYGTTPVSINDTRFVLENTDACQQDEVTYAGGNTEGFIGAMLRDVEDGENEGNEGPLDCSADLLSMGDIEIFTIFRVDRPTTVAQFIQAFRTRYPGRDRDFWVTIENNAPAMNFAIPPVAITSQPPACRVVPVSDTITLGITYNGGRASCRWRRNGFPLYDDSFLGISGAFTPTLTLRTSYAAGGSYTCLVTNCDEVQSVVSSPTEVRIEFPTPPQPLISWGENGCAQVGNGTQTQSAPPYMHPGLTDVIEAEGGRCFSMALRSDGTLLTWGNAQNGELGNGQWYAQVNSPAPILSNVVKIAAGKYYGLALLKDGSVKSWGWNFYGTLFSGDRDNRNTPGPTVLPPCVRDIAAGSEVSLALLSDGTVLSVGYNGYGSLGIGTFDGVSSTPQQVVGLTDVVAIDVGELWCMALKSDGTVWTWGNNGYGQLGLDHYNSVAVPTQVPGLSGITQISCGPDNAHVLRSDGRVFGWGYWPAIGRPDPASDRVPQLLALTNVTRVESGCSFAAALIGGRLMAWGLNSGVNPPNVGVFNNTGPYTQPTPVNVPEVFDISGFGTGCGTLHAFGSFGTTDVPTPGDDDVAPTVLALAASPNPSRAHASIQFDLPTAGPVALAIYDVAGRRVRALTDEPFEPGRHVRPWDGNTDAGARVAAGVYFVRLSAPGGSLTRALVRTE